MIISKTVKVKLWAKNMKYYLELGYVGNKGDIIDVDVKHLSDGSYSEIEVACDVCGRHRMLKYKYYNKSVKNMGYYTCPKCAPKKIAEVNQNRYGVKSASQIEEIKEKTRQTMIERYGVENASKSEMFKEKMRATNLERFGVPYPSQSPEVKVKVHEAFYRNGTQKTSKQQIYLHNLFNGEMNFPIKYYSADICFPKEKLIIEYDGSGHELNVKFGRITEEEQRQKEITRYYMLKREGYKQMRIISKNDKLPNDDVLLKMLSIAREYFSETSHSWIDFDISNSKMINSENKNLNGEFFNFGELRTIKEVA